MGTLEISHDILVAGPDFAACRQQVNHFFARTLLVRYDDVQVLKDASINGLNENFWPAIDAGLAANKNVLGDFLESLKQEGFASLDDLQSLEKGYLSKTLHTIAHLLDGFIGIDSRFYNLEEDSHTVSRQMQQKIAAAPGHYWIVRVKGRIVSSGEDPLDALRTFEEKKHYRD